MQGLRQAQGSFEEAPFQFCKLGDKSSASGTQHPAVRVSAPALQDQDLYILFGAAPTSGGWRRPEPTVAVVPWYPKARPPPLTSCLGEPSAHPVRTLGW